MSLTIDQLEKVEEYAAQFLTYQDIAILLKVDVNKFISRVTERNSLEWLAYERGKITSKAEIRRNIVKLAKHGSSQAEAMVEKFIDDQRISEIENRP